MKKIKIIGTIMLGLLVLVGTNVSAAEVFGNLSSTTTGQGLNGSIAGTVSVPNTIGGNVVGGSTIGGNVGGGGGSVGGGSTVGGTFGSGGGSTQNPTGQVLGSSTNGGSNNPGTILGASDTPGFPATGLESEIVTNAIYVIGLLLSLATLLSYSYFRKRKDA